MIERDDLVATYSVDYVAGVMSLRKPQKESLIRLEKIWNAAVGLRRKAEMLVGYAPVLLLRQSDGVRPKVRLNCTARCWDEA